MLGQQTGIKRNFLQAFVTKFLKVKITCTVKYQWTDKFHQLFSGLRIQKEKNLAVILVITEEEK